MASGKPPAQAAVLHRSKTDPNALHLEAYLEFMVGNFAEAERVIRDALRLTPSSAAYHFDLGLIYARSENFAKAKEAFLQAAALEPTFPDVFYNAGLMGWRQGDRRSARNLFKRALKLDLFLIFPLVRQLASSWRQRDKTLSCLARRGWLIATRDLPEIHDMISVGLLQRGQLGKATIEQQQAIDGFPTAIRYAALGDLLNRQSDLDAARKAYEQALARDSTLESARQALALIAFRQKRFDEARAFYESFVAKDPKDVFSQSRLLLLDTTEGRVDEAEARFRSMASSITAAFAKTESWEQLTTIAYRAVMWPLPSATHRLITRGIDDQLAEASRKRGGPLAGVFTRPAAGARLRVGYLSSNFRDHPIGHITAQLFGHHDRSRFDVHVFFVSASHTEKYTDQVVQGAEHFHRTAAKISEVARAIRQENIDLLIYLDGYMDHRLLEVVAMRPAPLQAFWMGHAGGCEISCIDYLIADPIVIPPSEDGNYRANVIRLDGPFACYSPEQIDSTPSRRAAGLPEKSFVFCGFNNPEKIDRVILDSWMRILAGVEGSVLWLSAGASQIFQDNIRAKAEAAGVAESRIVFAERLPSKAAHFARHKLCGLYLDTLTLNGATTALDALWAGLPVLTVRGDRFASRIAESFLNAIGLNDMTCGTLAEYEARAIAFATNPPLLEDVRVRLERNRETYPLFKIDTFCRSLEGAFDQIVEHASGRPRPRHVN